MNHVLYFAAIALSFFGLVVLLPYILIRQPKPGKAGSFIWEKSREQTQADEGQTYS